MTKSDEDIAGVYRKKMNFGIGAGLPPEKGRFRCFSGCFRFPQSIFNPCLARPSRNFQATVHPLVFFSSNSIQASRSCFGLRLLLSPCLKAGAVPCRCWRSATEISAFGSMRRCRWGLSGFGGRNAEFQIKDHNRKPSGKGSFGSTTNWWKPLTCALPRIRTTTPVNGPTDVSSTMRPSKTVARGPLFL